MALQCFTEALSGAGLVQVCFACVVLVAVGADLPADGGGVDAVTAFRILEKSRLKGGLTAQTIIAACRDEPWLCLCDYNKGTIFPETRKRSMV